MKLINKSLREQVLVIILLLVIASTMITDYLLQVSKTRLLFTETEARISIAKQTLIEIEAQVEELTLGETLAYLYYQLEWLAIEVKSNEIRNYLFKRMFPNEKRPM